MVPFAAKLNPHQIDGYATLLFTRAVTFLPDFVTALLILIVGWTFASWGARSLGKFLDRSRSVDSTVTPVITAAFKYTIGVLVLVVALSQLGVQTGSLLAIVGAAGLAIGLALQGTLTNIAAGIMLLWLRPFRVGDYIEVPANNISGMVREIGLFVSLVENFEGINIVAPNSQVWNAMLRNHTRTHGRLVSYALTFQGGANVDKAREILMNLVDGDSRVSRIPPPLLFVESMSPGGVVLNYSFHATPGHLGDIQRSIVEKVREALQASGEQTLVPQQIIRTLPADTDPARFLTPTSPIKTK